MTKQTHVYKDIDGWHAIQKVWKYNGTAWVEEVMPWTWTGTEWKRCMPYTEPVTQYDLYLRTIPDDAALYVESRLAGGTWSEGTAATYGGNNYRKFTYDEGASVEIRTYDTSGMFFFDEWVIVAGTVNIDTNSTTNDFTMPAEDVVLDAKWIG